MCSKSAGSQLLSTASRSRADSASSRLCGKADAAGTSGTGASPVTSATAGPDQGGQGQPGIGGGIGGPELQVGLGGSVCGGGRAGDAQQGLAVLGGEPWAVGTPVAWAEAVVGHDAGRGEGQHGRCVVEDAGGERGGGL